MLARLSDSYRYYLSSICVWLLIGMKCALHSLHFNTLEAPNFLKSQWLALNQAKFRLVSKLRRKTIKVRLNGPKMTLHAPLTRPHARRVASTRGPTRDCHTPPREGKSRLCAAKYRQKIDRLCQHAFKSRSTRILHPSTTT